MGESSAIMRDPSGGARLRCMKAGYTPLGLGTDRRFVTFDSAWANSFRVRASGLVSGSDLGGTRITSYGLGTAYRDVRILLMPGAPPYRPALAWQRNNGGTLSHFNGAGTMDTPLPYARGHGVSEAQTAPHSQRRRLGGGRIVITGTDGDGSRPATFR